MKSLFEKAYEYGIIPVFCPKNEDEFNTFLHAVLKTPIRIVEITLRSEFATKAIELLKQTSPDFCVGAGTILSEKAMHNAVDSGADFFVSPGYSEELIAYADKLGIPFLPGCSTPSEIQNALRSGLNVLKFFPAECSGGVDALTLYKGAFENVKFVPTGGISLDNLSKYLKLDNVIACGGSFMIPKDMLANGESDKISDVINKCLAIRGGKK